MKAENAVMRATIHIKRKETGKVETYEVVGFKEKEDLKEQDNGRNSHDDIQKHRS